MTGAFVATVEAEVEVTWVSVTYVQLAGSVVGMSVEPGPESCVDRELRNSQGQPAML